MQTTKEQQIIMNLFTVVWLCAKELIRHSFEHLHQPRMLGEAKHTQ